MTIPQRRRRGPNKPKAILEATPPGPLDELPATEAGKPTRRRKRADVNGMHLKLSAPSRAGYQRRWFNDTPGRLATAEELAYDHVRDAAIKSDGTDSRIRRLVGTQASGQPLYAYLMETPVEEYRAGIVEKEESHADIDAAINAGRDATGQLQNAYGEGSIGRPRLL